MANQIIIDCDEVSSVEDIDQWFTLEEKYVMQLREDIISNLSNVKIIAVEDDSIPNRILIGNYAFDIHSSNMRDFISVRNLSLKNTPVESIPGTKISHWIHNIDNYFKNLNL